MARPDPALVDLAAGRPMSLENGSERLVDSAREHRMGGLLWSVAASGGIELGPHSARLLMTDDLVLRALHRRMWEALDHIAGALDPLGIEVATFKGITAQARWYEREGERPCVDIDVLLPPGAEARATEVLRALQPDHRLIPYADRLASSGALQSMQLTVRGIPVDVHFDMLKLGIPSRLRETIWSRTIAFETPSGRTVRVPDPEVSLLHFLVHLNKDRFRYLLGFGDVARILSREEIDLHDVVHLARQDGLQVPVSSSLDAVCDTLGVAVPRLTASGLRARAWRMMWGPSVRLQGDLGVFRYRFRQGWLPLFTGRIGAAMRWWSRKPFPPRSLVAYYHGKEKGGYLRHITTGRFRGAIERSRAASLLSGPVGRDRDRAAVPTTEGD